MKTTVTQCRCGN